MTLDRRAIRPLPPGRMQGNGSYTPDVDALDTGHLVLSWTHRDRLTQTSPVIVDHTGASIGPEPGVSYIVEVRWVDPDTGVAISPPCIVIDAGTVTAWTLAPEDIPERIGWRGNGTLWSSNTASAVQRVTGLPPYGAGDVLMFVLDPATAALWIGINGIWHDDPVGDPPTWTAGGSSAFYPQIQGRDPGDGGTLRSTPAQFSYPVPPGVQALSFDVPDLQILMADCWLDLRAGQGLSSASVDIYLEVNLP